MEKDNVLKLEEIRKTVKFEKFTPNKFIDIWMGIFGGETTIRIEKFVNSGEKVVAVGDSILKGVKVTPVENLIFLTWKGRNELQNDYEAIDSGYFLGVQNHENNTKSLILVHSMRDEKTGKDRQTTRRFTPINK